MQLLIQRRPQTEVVYLDSFCLHFPTVTTTCRMPSGDVFELFTSKPSERVGAMKYHPFTVCAKHNVISADTRSSRVTCYSSESQVTQDVKKSHSDHVGQPVNLRRYVKKSKVEDYVIRTLRCQSYGLGDRRIYLDFQNKLPQSTHTHLLLFSSQLVFHSVLINPPWKGE